MGYWHPATLSPVSLSAVRRRSPSFSYYSRNRSGRNDEQVQLATNNEGVHFVLCWGLVTTAARMPRDGERGTAGHGVSSRWSGVRRLGDAEGRHWRRRRRDAEVDRMAVARAARHCEALRPGRGGAPRHACGRDNKVRCLSRPWRGGRVRRRQVARKSLKCNHKCIGGGAAQEEAACRIQAGPPVCRLGAPGPAGWWWVLARRGSIANPC